MEDHNALQIEVVDVNYYMSKPMPLHAIPELPQGPFYGRAQLVPVVRVFGSTPRGQKCCAHLHGLLPYFYMRCENDHVFDTPDTLVELLPKIAQDIENAIRTLSQPNDTTSKMKQKKTTNAIAKLVIVKGIPFYGYHSNEQLFIKVYLYDPTMMSRIVQVVESGLVTQRVFQPYEAHIPYLLQVFADNHIEGMNYLHLQNFVFRSPLPHAQPHLTNETGKLWISNSTNETFDGRYAPVRNSTLWNARTSICSLELDVSHTCILNPIMAKNSECYVPSLGPLWEEEKLRRRAAGLAGTPEVQPSIQRMEEDDLNDLKTSPLSQSDFNEQMWASFNAILAKHEAKNGNYNSVMDHTSSIDDTYSYSQMDHNDVVDHQEEENNELLALLAKLHENFDQQRHDDLWRDQHIEDPDINPPEEIQEDDDETQSILASQIELDQGNQVDQPREDNIPWWEIDSTTSNTLDVNTNELAASEESPRNWFSYTQTSRKRNFSQTRRYAIDPPTLLDLLDSTTSESPNVHYSKDSDVPEKPVVFAGRKFTFQKQGAAYLKVWNERRDTPLRDPNRPTNKVKRVRTPLLPPPTTGELNHSQKQSQRSSITESQPASAAMIQSSVHVSNITVLSVEIHVNTRGNLLPDPSLDAVLAIGYAIEANEGDCTTQSGVLVVENEAMECTMWLSNQPIHFKSFPSEQKLFEGLSSIVYNWDPDFLAGYEVQQSSWGYLIDRATQLPSPINFIQSLSRLPLVPMDSRNNYTPTPQEGTKIGTVWGMKKASGIWMHGRHVLNLWRCARSELKLNRYTFESVVWHALKRRVPVYSHELLTSWFQQGGSVRAKALDHLMLKTTLNLAVLDSMQLVTRTSEMARLFGIDFYSVLSRGSQYRVEAVNIRVTKRLNYILVSPNRQQVAAQPPMECIPLVMEPLSAFYGDPIVVLDFQSLYPSMMIAYNICYSTCFGHLVNGMDPSFESVFGVNPSHVVDMEGLMQAGKSTIITPNGALFCPKSQRQGVVPLVLSEILSTRIMIKQAMKKTTNRKLYRVLDARQMALKMIANVTYGYTAASFSGRMPSAQIADAIVQSGRMTLEAAIKTVESHQTWNAKVVYGDTDSLFVELKGRNLSQALEIGNEIATKVTAMNPKPVCLKLEKVYMGSFLVSKKRYVGMKYEDPNDKGTLDAKGIETIRRDSCGIVQQTMRKWLQILFATRDLSQCKHYLQHMWTKMHHGQIPLNWYIFAKEVRLGTYAGQGPPAALVAKKRMAKDHRAEPRYAERVPYVVIRGTPGAKLMDLVVSPGDFIDGQKYSVHVEYYITKQILPSLERLAILMGVDVRKWYLILPRRAEKAMNRENSLPLMRIDAYYSSQHCRVCSLLTRKKDLCDMCRNDEQKSMLAVHQCIMETERKLAAYQLLCMPCMGSSCQTTGNAVSMICKNDGCPVWNHSYQEYLHRESWNGILDKYLKSNAC